MTRRVLFVFAAVALLVASCGGGSEQSAGGAVMARPLAYSLTGDATLSYHAEMETEMTTTFGEEIRSLDPSMPSTMLTQMEMSFDSTYRISEGPEPGTYRVSMTLDGIELGKGSVQMGGQSLDLSDVPQSELDAALASQMPEFVYVIDDKGAIISVEVDGTTVDVGGILGGTSTSGMSGGQMFGPQLPDGQVNIGDSWTTSSEQSVGDVVIVTEETHTILRSEERNGYDTWVIRTESDTSGYTINWDDMIAMFEEMGGIGAVDGMEEMPPSFQMAMRSSPTAATTITWLDPELGRAVAMDVMANMAMTMELGGIPGMAGSMSMEMDGFTHMTMELTN
ncbi:MAG: hypothetical protein QNJ81_03835 [Acidimicrobiia bacterium]|nr:hypothetical protein [Acidimicrobiia bacterium]